MKKIKCEICGRLVPKKGTVMLFDIDKSHAVRACETCYYKKVAEWQGMVKGIEEMRKEGIQ